MINVNNLSLHFDERLVVSQLSFEIKSGTISAIVGRNGAGKSSLLAAIAGDIALSEGEIKLNGLEVGSMKKSELADIRSLAQQSHSYWMAYTAREILHLGNEKVPSARIDYLIKALELNAFLDQTITTLSGGELQRIEIARAFVREVPLVLLDEPFASQDIYSIKRIRELLQNEKSRGVTVVLVDHARDKDLGWCDQVIDLDFTAPVQ